VRRVREKTEREKERERRWEAQLLKCSQGGNVMLYCTEHSLRVVVNGCGPLCSARGDGDAKSSKKGGLTEKGSEDKRRTARELEKE